MRAVLRLWLCKSHKSRAKMILSGQAESITQLLIAASVLMRAYLHLKISHTTF